MKLTVFFLFTLAVAHDPQILAPIAAGTGTGASFSPPSLITSTSPCGPATPSSTTGTCTLVSGGAAGDVVCLVSDAANHWYAYVQKGTWTNN